MKARGSLVVLALAIAVPSALAWPGRPASAPPTAPNPGAPPPAWMETQAKSAWLAYGSYCWKTACVNMIPPNTRPDLPLFTVKRGQAVRAHLGFNAKSAAVSIDTKLVQARLDTTKHVVSWTPTRSGIVTVSARAAVGTASYVTRLSVR